jgi:N-acetylglucosaminyldiphosphoundecaprenol N-acetyl-beta-D-mannosaminyltransferase
MSNGDLPARANVLGTQVNAASFETAVAWLADAVRARRPAIVSAANVYSVMLGHRNVAFRAKVNRADYVLTDGVSMVWVSRLLGYAAEQVSGDDLMLAGCTRFPHWRHFLLGGAAGQPAAVAAELQRRIAGIQVVGTYATPTRPVPARETERILAAIDEARPEVVWVGMGTPVQDEWMRDNADRISVPMVGVGSTFDLLTGRKRRAPLWMRRSGLEWLFRLAQEPRRLAGRYLFYNPLFIWQFTLQYLGVRKYPA